MSSEECKETKDNKRPCKEESTKEDESTLKKDEDNVPGENNESNLPQSTLNVTGVRGGAVGSAITAGIVHGGIGNTWNTYNALIVTKPDQNPLLERTKEEIEFITAGMIRVSAVEVVLQKLKGDQRWVTITGNAGDGKTTLGYLALKEFLQKNVNVFTVNKPEEYDQIVKMKEERVIMFDDRFGAFLADHQLIKNWLDVIGNLITFINKRNIRVIFVSRKNVVNESKKYLGKFTDTMFIPKCVVDLSKRKVTGERLDILGYHLQHENVTVKHESQVRVANNAMAHGFPYCCKMYSKLKSNGYDVDIDEFFESPLKFLDKTTEVLYNDNCKDLFQLMIKNNGKFDVFTIRDDDKRQKLLRVEKEQEGSYITVWRNGICEFAHPSVYESVLNVINDIDPLYCVQYATLSVIRQKMIISTSNEEDSSRSPCLITVKPIPAVLKVLAKRFQKEILEGDYSVFKHRLCGSKEFCETLVTCCVNTNQDERALTELINRPDVDGDTMLWTALKGGNISAVCALIKAGADLEDKSDDYGTTPLHYLCKGKGVKLGHILHTLLYQRLCDDNGDNDDELLVDIDAIGMIITEGKVDVNICDAFGRTPLHYLLQHHLLHEEAIKFIIIDMKGDLNRGDFSGDTTPLLLQA